MREPVLTKMDFTRRYKAGEFGNAAPTWDTLEEFYASGYYGHAHIRNRIAGGKTFYNIPWNLVEAVFRWDAVGVAGIHPSNLYISAMAPTELTLLQGEVQRGLWGLDLTYTTVRKPMRDALAECTKHANGTMASTILRHYLCANSLEWLGYLLDEYPDHVVEFSTYEVDWGTVPGYNSVFWEVRTWGSSYGHLYH